MATAAVAGSPGRDGPWTNPWPWLSAGLLVLGSAFTLAQLGGGSLAPIRVGLVFLGIVASGAAVCIRPAAPLVLAGAAAAAFLGAFALYLPDQPEQWNSVRMFLAAAAVVALLAAGIMLLPRLGRRIVVSLLVVLHFGGILSAVLSAQPGIWLAGVAYTYVYRPYLEFMYLTNAYHFYAPEPGPAYLFWFDIEYIEDGKSAAWHWKKVPNLDQDGWPQYSLALRYQRRIALATLASNEREYSALEQQIAALERAKANRERYRQKLPLIPRNADPSFPQRMMYGPPTLYHAMIVQSYVAHVAHEFKQDHPQATITGIKVYRVEHHFLSAIEFADGDSPQDPKTYFPYFWGEFEEKQNREWKLKDYYDQVAVVERKDGKFYFQTERRLKQNQDGFLYWQLPFLHVNPDGAGFLINTTNAIPEPPEDPKILHQFRRGAEMKEQDVEAFNKADLENLKALLFWQEAVDKAALECMQLRRKNPQPGQIPRQVPPKAPDMVLGYAYLHAGGPTATWILYPGDTEWKPR